MRTLPTLSTTRTLLFAGLAAGLAALLGCGARAPVARAPTVDDDRPWPDPAVASLSGLYGSAHFMERECHEMYGIVFAGNRDLRPLLLYEGFKGHPLRKDYPKELEQPLVPYREGYEMPGGE